MNPYPYQHDGIQKLLEFYGTGQHGALLADEPGLGKTVQAIMTAAALGAVDILVVCPSKLKINWAREITAWLPGKYMVQLLRGRKACTATFGFPLVQVVNYDLLKDIDWSGAEFDLIIADEAHRLRNPDAKWTIAFAAISAKRRLLLTGTPIVNRPREIWQLLLLCGLVCPAQFHEFGVRYCQARQIPEFRTRGSKKNGTLKTIRELVWNYDGAANLEELNQKLYKMCMIRRMKATVLPDLPPKTHRLVEFDKLGHSDLGVLDRLRTLQVAKSNRDLRGLGPESYNSAVVDLDDAIQIAFEEIALVRHETALEKVPLAIDYIEEALEESDKLIVFAHHRDVLEQLEEALIINGRFPALLMGGMSDDKSQLQVDVFQNDPACRVFLGQMDACGEGLTLTAASRVIFVELPWSPSAEDQCSDRAHRIGQKDNVLVEHLVIENTIDARIAKTLIKKRKIIGSAIDKQGPDDIDWLSELT